MTRGQANGLKKAARDLAAMGENTLAAQVAAIADPYLGRKHFGQDGGLPVGETPAGDIFADLADAPGP